MQCRKTKWCPRPESNRHDREVEGFSYHFGFRRQRMRCSWSGARLHHSLAAVGARRLLSTPSQPGGWTWLGVGSDARHPGLSPTLTGFTSGVSTRRLKLFKSLVSTDFTTRALRDALEPTLLSAGSCLAPDHRCEPRSYALNARKPLSLLTFRTGGESRKDLTKQISSPLRLPVSPPGQWTSEKKEGRIIGRGSFWSNGLFAVEKCRPLIEFSKVTQSYTHRES